MDTSIVIALALAALYLITVPGILSRHLDAKLRVGLDVLPKDIVPVRVSVKGIESAGVGVVERAESTRSTSPLLTGSTHEKAASTLELPKPIAAAADSPISGWSLSAPRPQLTVISGEGSKADEQSAESARYLDLAAGEMYPATHTTSTAKVIVMNAQTPTPPQRGRDQRTSGPTRSHRPTAPRGAGSGRPAGGQSGKPRSAQPGPARSGSAQSGSAQSGSAQSGKPRSAQPGLARSGSAQSGSAQSRSAQPGSAHVQQTKAPARPLNQVLGVAFIGLAATTLVTAVVAVFGGVSWAVPLLFAALAVADLVILRGTILRNGERQDSSSGTDVSRRAASKSEQARSHSPLKYSLDEGLKRDEVRRVGTTGLARREVVARYPGNDVEGAPAPARNGATAVAAINDTAVIDTGINDAAINNAGINNTAISDSGMGDTGTNEAAIDDAATNSGAINASERKAPELNASERNEIEPDDLTAVQGGAERKSIAELSAPSTPVPPVEESARSGSTSSVFVDLMAKRSASAQGWTPVPLPKPTYVELPKADRGAQRPSIDDVPSNAARAEAEAMEFVSLPSRRPELDDLAHGRTATRPGKAQPAAVFAAQQKSAPQSTEEHPNKAVRQVAHLDDILSRRRA